MMMHTFHVAVSPAAVGDAQADVGGVLSWAVRAVQGVDGDGGLASVPPKPAWKWACNVGGVSGAGSKRSWAAAARATWGCGNSMVRGTFTCSSSAEGSGGAAAADGEGSRGVAARTHVKPLDGIKGSLEHGAAALA
jgi:hypothetical protein